MNKNYRFILLIASFFFIWTLAIHIDRKIDENYDYKQELINKKFTYESYVLITNQINNLTRTYSSIAKQNLNYYFMQYVQFCKEKVDVLNELLEDTEISIQMYEERNDRLSILNFIFPEYIQKNKLYLETIKLEADAHDLEIQALESIIGNKGSYSNQEANDFQNEMFLRVEKKEELRIQSEQKFREYYWKYFMYKSLIYQWPKGTYISLVTAGMALYFIIITTVEFRKSSKIIRSKYIQFILGLSAFAFFYSFMFFGPLMLLPKIPYISW